MRGTLVGAIIGLFCLFMCIGCGSKTSEVIDKIESTESTIITQTDKIYTAIKVIVTDEQIKELFSEEDLAKLKELEEKYIAAKAILEKDVSDESSIADLISIANDVLILVGQEALTEKYGTEITAIRIGINLLLSFYEG